MIGQNYAPDLWTAVDLRNHPLADWHVKFNFKGWGSNGWLPNVAMYSADNKRFTEYTRHAEKLPHTEVWYRVIGSVSNLKFRSVSMVFWLRRNSKRQIEEAIATLLMLHSYPVVVLRAFEPK